LRIKGPFKAKGLANNPLDPVSLHRPFELSVDTDSDPVVSQFIGTENQREAFSMPALSLPIHRIKLPTLTNQGCFREFKPRQRQLSGKTLTTFGTTGIENCTTCTGGHSGTKSMGTLPFNITGLKSTFTHHLLLVRDNAV